MAGKTLKDVVEKESFREHDMQEKSKNREVYVPRWAQTLIDLYTSSLKDEVLREMKEDK